LSNLSSNSVVNKDKELKSLEVELHNKTEELNRLESMVKERRNMLQQPVAHIEEPTN
jgi:hypothetical protein